MRLCPTAGSSYSERPNKNHSYLADRQLASCVCEWLVIFVHYSVWLYLYFGLLHPFSFYKEKSLEVEFDH